MLTTKTKIYIFIQYNEYLNNCTIINGYYSFGKDLKFISLEEKNYLQSIKDRCNNVKSLYNEDSFKDYFKRRKETMNTIYSELKQELRLDKIKLIKNVNK